MTSPTLASILQFAGVKPSLFAANSRYLGIETATLSTSDGRNIAYVRRRFVPQAVLENRRREPRHASGGSSRHHGTRTSHLFGAGHTRNAKCLKESISRS